MAGPLKLEWQMRRCGRYAVYKRGEVHAYANGNGYWRFGWLGVQRTGAVDGNLEDAMHAAETALAVLLARHELQREEG